jgi:5,10-methylenetetrahydromethanopterin reductase
MPEISIAFQTDKTPAQYIALAKLVDQYAFDAISVYNDLPFHPSFSPLMLMAPHIRRARLGVAAVSPSRMAPIDMAANIALLAQVAAGGTYLGISRGAWLRDHGIQEISSPIQAIRECAEIVKAIFSGNFRGYEGQIYCIAPHVKIPYALPEKPVPLLIGTWGKKLCAVAGELADEVKVGGSANPDLVPVIQSYLATGEQLAGRDAGSVSVVMGTVTVVDEDREMARQAARRSVALYLPVVAPLEPTLKIDPDLIQRLQMLANQQDWETASRQISDDLLGRFAFSGNPHDLIDHAIRLFEAGAGRVEFGTPHGIPSEKGIRLLGEKVLPSLKKHLGAG